VPRSTEHASPRPPDEPPVAADDYTEAYYLESVEGYEQFRASAGQAISPRLERALALADLRPGRRVLDIGCGRGDVLRSAAARGAYALGIDYSHAAMRLVADVLGRSRNGHRAGVARMDATRLALRPQSFDVALMLDVVEHLYQPDLERALAEAHTALKPGGRLVIHTSPNRVYEDVVYPYYVRNVHSALLNTARALHLPNGFLNEIVLPTERLPPHDEYERRLHVNPQSRASLRDALRRHRFRIRTIDYWEPPPPAFLAFHIKRLSVQFRLLDAVRFLRPFSRFPPLNRLFSNHIWIVAERR
jgi:cyclopropane fatty-acyl-phospholipid synthase-like methyltransferase